MTTCTRTQDEIIARFGEISPTTDFLGTERTDLLGALDAEHLAPFLKDPEAAKEHVPADPLEEIRKYMPFAIEKALGHRGIAASRSVDHMRAWVWLLGDEQYEAIDWEDFPQYGMPILSSIASLLEIDLPDDERVRRMARGDYCEADGCYEGCGS